ncbi:AsmA family protein, partial [Ruegeria sp.]|uniref:AsmA family protein n=1 Tax=Ruegeria sp. TaxID=1879320 RepID=UPI0023135338
MKWLIRILFILVAVFGLVLGALLLMPGDKLGAILAEQVKTQTGRDLTLSGDVSLSFWPVLGMETGPVTFGNAEWAGSEPMLSAQSLAVGVDASALLGGDIRIKRVLADNPVLRLELNDGRGNWELTAPVSTTQPAAVSGAAPSSGAITLERLELTNARLIYVENGQIRMDFADVDLSARWPEVSAPMQMQASMPVTGGAVNVDLTIPDLPAFATGSVTSLVLNMTAPGGAFNYAGRVNLAGEMDGKIDVKSSDTDRMLAAFGQGGVSVPQGLGKVAEVTGQITYTSDGRISLRDMVAVLDQNRVSGEADIQIAATPQITARLNAG